VRRYALLSPGGWGHDLAMKRLIPIRQIRLGVLGLLVMLGLRDVARTQPPAAAVSAFNTYAGKMEARLAQELRSPAASLTPVDVSRLRDGQVVIEKMTPADVDLPGAMLHDWRGTAFVPGATPSNFEQLMRNFDAYPLQFAPQVERARVLAHNRDHYTMTMRVRQKHVLTVVLDTTYDVTFGRVDAHRGYSFSRSTQIREIESPGTPKERTLTASEEHGFLWRLNTYWTYEERDGGLYLQIESVSLTRSIPAGLGWAVRPFVESIPKESLEFTLRRTGEALNHEAVKGARG
jgi:hypothetical protein